MTENVEIDYERLVEKMMRNVKYPEKGSYHTYRWMAVQQHFECSPSEARALCRRFNLNPNDEFNCHD